MTDRIGERPAVLDRFGHGGGFLQRPRSSKQQGISNVGQQRDQPMVLEADVHQSHGFVMRGRHRGELVQGFIEPLPGRLGLVHP